MKILRLNRSLMILMVRTRRQTEKFENDFESTKTKIIKTAKDSQTASPISMEAVHEINKRLAEKKSS
jgi:hypothetical protein